MAAPKGAIGREATRVIASLCIYCGSNTGTDSAHTDLARSLGEACAQRDIELVFGGGAIGLMGAAADGALAAGGRVTGIIPTFLEQPEIAHPGVTEMVVVDSMHARKQRMFERSDAFAVLPGGIGTLDETVEIITWRLLGLHDKPIVLVDHQGFWRPLLALIDHFVDSGFAWPELRDLYAVVDGLDALFAHLEAGGPSGIATDADRL